MRLPTTRRAYWIGIRRWPSFMKTTPTTIAAAITPIVTAVTGSSWTQPRTAPGRLATMLAKMSSEMPLPTPRWVTSSPSHMTMVVPAVSEITMR